MDNVARAAMLAKEAGVSYGRLAGKPNKQLTEKCAVCIVVPGNRCHAGACDKY